MQTFNKKPQLVNCLIFLYFSLCAAVSAGLGVFPVPSGSSYSPTSQFSSSHHKSIQITISQVSLPADIKCIGLDVMLPD